MEKHRKKFSIRLIEKIGHDEEEREIIQYGLHQGFLILLNLLTTVVCGILWKELPFVLLVFWGIFFLRPYAGGYHADTELRCYFLSTAMMNMVVFLKKTIVLSNIMFIIIWIITVIFIWIYAPVENTIHCLDEDARKKYANNTKKILLCNGIVMLVGIWVNQRIVVDAIIWSQVMIAIAVIAGLWKYST